MFLSRQRPFYFGAVQDRLRNVIDALFDTHAGLIAGTGRVIAERAVDVGRNNPRYLSASPAIGPLKTAAPHH